MPSKPDATRQPPLDGGALRAALLDGLRFWTLATGTPYPGDAAELVDHQLSSVRRACQREDPPNVRTRPPMRLAQQPAEAEDPPQLPWWRRD